MSWRDAIKPAIGLFLCSWFAVLIGIQVGKTSWVPRGEGLDLHSGIHRNLFRFDAEYYRTIANNGYFYNGDPHSSPNIVFAPLFPILIDLVAHAGIDDVNAGFLVSRIFLFGSILILILFLRELYRPTQVFWILFAMFTAAGAYSFQAYYSESTMLFFLSSGLLAHQRRNWPVLAIATSLLGATRVAALPIVLLYSAWFFKMAWTNRNDLAKSVRFALFGLVCPTGLAAYLGFIAFKFGNPFQLFPEIQGASWGFFHPPIDWFGLLSGWKIIEHALAAAEKGTATFTDPKTLNLIWTCLGMAGAIYGVIKFKWMIVAWVFAVYFLFVYLMNSTSDYLISAHRFFALMIPIYLMFAGLHEYLRKKNLWLARAVTGLLLLLNLAYGLLHTAYFNNGVWYFF